MSLLSFVAVASDLWQLTVNFPQRLRAEDLCKRWPRCRRPQCDRHHHRACERTLSLCLVEQLEIGGGGSPLLAAAACHLLWGAGHSPLHDGPLCSCRPAGGPMDL